MSLKDIITLEHEIHPGSLVDMPLWRLAIMSAELGQMSRVYIYSQAMSSDVVDVRAHLANMRIELADLITQCRVLAVEMGWDWTMLLGDGEERYGERIKEVQMAQITKRRPHVHRERD